MVEKITLNEVSPRDWRFSHRASPGTEEVFNTIKMLESAGVERIEVGASVNYSRYPYLADTFELLGRLRSCSESKARYSVYVGPYKQNYPKDKVNSLLEKKLLSQDPGMPEELSFSISASEERNKELYGLTGNQMLEHIEDHIERAKQDGVKFFRGYISSAFGYKNSHDSPVSNVIGLTNVLLGLGCYEVAIGDSRGYASPREFKRKWAKIKKEVPLEKIAFHFHENYYLTWENDVLTLLEDGVRTFDTSVMDFTQPTTGKQNHAVVFRDNIPPNASTEKMIYFIDQQVNSPDYEFKKKLGNIEISTGLDYDTVRMAGEYIRKAIQEKIKGPHKEKINAKRLVRKLAHFIF